jgi:hypothetical protein
VESYYRIHEPVALPVMVVVDAENVDEIKIVSVVVNFASGEGPGVKLPKDQKLF